MSEERPTGWQDADRWFSDEPPTGGDGEGGDGGAGGEPEGPPPVPRCEVCGAELEPDQTYCLECGSPTPLAPRLRRGGRAAAIVAGAMVILGVGAGALAYAVANDDDEPSATATSVTSITAPPTATATVAPPPLTGPLPPDTSVTTPTAPATTSTTPPATGFETVTGVTPTTPPSTGETTTAEEPEPEPEPDSGSSDWPSGETAWTAVLSSVRDESDARAAKTRLEGSGEPAGVLFSTDYAGLQPGYWVVFSGMFDGRGQAVSQAAELRSGYPGAYARQIEG